MEFTEIATGYCFLEAPRIAGDCLWFTDLLLGGLHRRSPDGTIDVFMPERRHIGGICVNEDGRIILGGHGGLMWFDPKTNRSGWVLQGIEGEKLTGANDFLPDGKGGIYFGTLSSGGDYGGEPIPTAIWHIDADRKVRKMDSGLKFANGIGISPDGGTLYHNESKAATFAYDIAPDGTLGNKRVFVDREDGDGLAVDMEGGVWIASFETGELYRYRPDGSLDRTIAMPHKVVSSLCFGGTDGRDIYVTTGGNDGVESMMRGEMPPREASVLHARSDIPGVPVAVTRFKLPD